MLPIIPISLKKQAVRKLSAVRHGELSRQEAEEMLRHRLRYSSKIRADLIEALTAEYDKEIAEALRFFRLI